MDPSCERDSVVFWGGPETSQSQPFLPKNSQSDRSGDRCTQAGNTTKQQEGRGWKEGEGWIRGEGKYLPRASDGPNEMKTQKQTESRSLSRKKCENQKWMDAWVEGWMDEWIEKWVDGWRDGWMDRGMDGWIDRCMDR